ncbi:MAG: hypothetical protein PHT21_09280 [Lachnospiraceae bacterium]|nr:hypothetical protein [Lachnospiraceae bacterium]
MNGIFCGTVVHSDEEYQKVIRFRMKVFIGMFFAGIFTFCAVFAVMKFMPELLSDYQSGTYTGFASGLTVVSVLLWIKNRSLLHNEEKRRTRRLADSDERNIEISQKAMRIAALVMIFSLYVIGLIGGFFYPILTKVLLLLVCLFLFVYVVAFKRLEKKM